MNKIISEPVLECRHIVKTFHDGALYVKVLKDVNFTVHKRERIAIVGASGSGKSTLLHILGGLDKPTSGQVFINGHEMTKLSDSERSYLRNRKLGFVYQFHHILPEFTVLENVAMPLLLRDLSVNEAKEQAQYILEKVGLAQRTQHKLNELSGGERQRTAVARALVTNPSCVLADEPTGNLDQRTAAQVYELMLQLNEDFHTSFVIVTHDERLAKKMDRILTLNNGSLVDYNFSEHESVK